MSHDVGICYCNDGSLAAAVVFQERDGFAVRALSNILGMGWGEYEQDIVPGHFDEVVCYNSFAGGWILLRRGTSLWRVKLSTGKMIKPVINVDPVMSVDADDCQWEAIAMANVAVDDFKITKHRAVSTYRLYE